MTVAEVADDRVTGRHHRAVAGHAPGVVRRRDPRRRFRRPTRHRGPAPPRRVARAPWRRRPLPPRARRDARHARGLDRRLGQPRRGDAVGARAVAPHRSGDRAMRGRARPRRASTTRSTRACFARPRRCSTRSATTTARSRRAGSTGCAARATPTAGPRSAPRPRSPGSIARTPARCGEREVGRGEPGDRPRRRRRRGRGRPARPAPRRAGCRRAPAAPRLEYAAAAPPAAG